jgi:flavin-dependent dehydrogenase
MSADLQAGGFLDLHGSTWDAIVIGAGPAGALAARRLSLAGASVLLVEKKQFPRAKVCGACLSRAALAELRLAGLDSLVPTLGGIDLTEFHLRFRGRSLRMELSGGAVVSRARLDAGLAAAAVSAGCRFSDGTLALVDEDSSGGRAVRLMQQGRCARAVARTVLVAGGLAQCLRPTTAEPSTHVARGSRIGAGCGLAEAPAAFGEHAVFMALGAGGYVGIVRVEDGSLNVAAAFDPALVRRVKTPGAAALEVLAEAGAPRLDALTDAQWHGTPGLTRQTRPLARDRLFFLGDAAGYVEPFTGEGIAWALASARAVEPLALKAINRWDPRLTREWGQAYHAVIGRHQLICRALALGLRQPWLIRLGFEILVRAPVARAAMIRLLNTPSALPTAS